jgi:hypothetical protein
MAGRTPFKAYQNYQKRLQAALNCIVVERLTVPGVSPHEIDFPYTVTLHRGHPVNLRGPHRLSLVVSQSFRIVEAEGDRGPYRVQTISYFYEVATRAGDEVLVYHWTPETEEGRNYGHLHVGRSCIAEASPLPHDRFHRLHIPTGRVSLESILRFLIEDLEVPSRKENWRDVLSNTERAFNQHRTRS